MSAFIDPEPGSQPERTCTQKINVWRYQRRRDLQVKQVKRSGQKHFSEAKWILCTDCEPSIAAITRSPRATTQAVKYSSRILENRNRNSFSVNRPCRDSKYRDWQSVVYQFFQRIVVYLPDYLYRKRFNWIDFRLLSRFFDLNTLHEQTCN